MCVCIYIYTHRYVVLSLSLSLYLYIYIYICIEREGCIHTYGVPGPASEADPAAAHRADRGAEEAPGQQKQLIFVTRRTYNWLVKHHYIY